MPDESTNVAVTEVVTSHAGEANPQPLPVPNTGSRVISAVAAAGLFLLTFGVFFIVLLAAIPIFGLPSSLDLACLLVSLGLAIYVVWRYRITATDSAKKRQAESPSAS